MAQAPHFDFRMRIAVEFATPLALDGPLWSRRILHVAGGEFDGPGLQGQVMPGGGDWVLVRNDGSAELDIRFTLRTGTGELVYVRSTGLFVAPDAVMARIRGGEDVPVGAYYFRTSALFETAAQRLNHLNHALHVGAGRRTPTGMITDLFAIS